MENEKVKILILTAPYGNGHLSVANALMEVFKKHENIDYLLYDIYTEDYPKTANLFKKIYMKTYKRGIPQQAYRFVYYGSDKLFGSKIAKPYQRFGIKKLVKKIEEYKPNIILNTFPVVCSYCLASENIHIPLYTVITDYYANVNWISKEARKHFVSSENVVAQLKSKGIDDMQHLVTGIPIKPIFYEEYTEKQIEELQVKYKIDKNKKVILLVAGANGVIPKFNKLVKDFTNEENIQLLVICGRNRRLYFNLLRKFGHNKNIQIFEFVNTIHELMRVSDLMITKPGGITMTEAANIGIPVVLYKPVYGQELENAIYFSSKRAASIALQSDELVYKTLSILNDPNLLNDMKKNIKKIAIKHSASLIIDSILTDYKNYLGERNENNQNS